MSRLQQIKDKIQGYKSYNQQVKDRVLKQIEGLTELSEAGYLEAKRNLPKVMQGTKKLVVKLDKLSKQVVKLERHEYAPEMNKLHLTDGKTISTPQKVTIESAVEYWHWKRLVAEAKK